jgi:hypothetical protein
METDNIRDKNVYDVFNEYFAHIDDPGQAHKISYLLSEVLFITVLAIIAGADDFKDYILALKGNHGNLYKEVTDLFDCI